MNNDERHQPLPEAARRVLEGTVKKLEAENEQVENSRYHTQTETGQRYYEGMLRGIETALVILAGEAELQRQRHVKGGEPKDNE